jgi:hypothetical protein
MKISQLKLIILEIVKQAKTVNSLGEIYRGTIRPYSIKHAIYQTLQQFNFRRIGNIEGYMEFIISGFATVMCAIDSKNKTIRVEKYYDDEERNKIPGNRVIKEFSIPESKGEQLKLAKDVVYLCKKLSKSIREEAISNQNNLNEALSPKSIATLEKWRKELGDRKTGVKLIDTVLERRIGIVSADLPDTATFANGLDDIEVFLKEGKYDSAIQQAIETAREMVEEEGGEGLFEETDDQEVIYKDRQGGQWVYWIDNRDTGGKIFIKPENIDKYLRKGYHVVELEH